MFNKQQEQHLKLLEEARDLQRMGDLKGFALKTAELEEMSKQLDKLADKPTIL